MKRISYETMADGTRREYRWLVCEGGAIGVPVLTPEELARQAQEHREWRERRYPGPTIGRDPDEVRRIAAAKKRLAQRSEDAST